MKRKKIENFARRLIILSIVLYLLSVITFFSPFLTPLSKLGSVKDTTVAEILADTSYFVFVAGLLINLLISRNNN